MSDNGTFRGQCFCGAVEIAVTGEPAGMGYCHCSSCRSWSASPVNAFTLWKPDSVKVVRGADQIGVYNKSDNSFRKWCKRCGGHLMNEHPKWGVIDVYAATIPALEFSPGAESSTFEKFAKNPAGHIDLQDHGDEVAYRNIKIRKLETR